MSLVDENGWLNAAEVHAGATRLRSTPLQVNVELTGICNVDPPCVFCSGKNFGHNYPPLDPAYLERYGEFLERCKHVNEDSFGEPLGHPGLVDLARRVTGNGQEFSFVTNGLLLSPKKAEQLAACGPNLGIHVSFNAANEATFHQLTGKSFARVVENVRCYVETYCRQNDGAAPDLTLTFIVMKVNRHEVGDFLRLARKLGTKALLAPLHDRPSVPLGRFGYDFVYTDEMLPYAELLHVGEEALALSRDLGIECLLQWDARNDYAVHGFSEPEVPIPCLVPWRFLFIQEHTQRVFACPYHRHPYGDLRTDTLEEIWNGEAAQEMRFSLVAGEIPKFCRDHSAGCPLVMEAKSRGGEIGDDVTVGVNDFHQLTKGWHELELLPEPIRWTTDAAEFLIRAGRGEQLFVEAIVWGSGKAERTVHGRVEVSGRELGDLVVNSADGWSRLAFRLPAAMPDGAVRGRIVTDDAWVPADHGVGGDTRRLGIAVRRISVA